MGDEAEKKWALKKGADAREISPRTSQKKAIGKRIEMQARQSLQIEADEALRRESTWDVGKEKSRFLGS